MEVEWFNVLFVLEYNKHTIKHKFILANLLLMQSLLMSKHNNIMNMKHNKPVII